MGALFRGLFTEMYYIDNPYQIVLLETVCFWLKISSLGLKAGLPGETNKQTNIMVVQSIHGKLETMIIVSIECKTVSFL